MGRSQVERNRTARGRGSGRGGRSGSHGGGRGTPRSRTAAVVLGDNSHRYESHHGRANDDNNDDDDNDDPGGWMMTFEGVDDAAYRDVVFRDVKKSNDISTLGGGDATDERHRVASDLMNDGDGQDGVAEDWIRIDIKALDECLRKIPIHERLGLPRHVGDHLVRMYGEDVCRKKTLGELREESHCVVGTTESEMDNEEKEGEKSGEEAKGEEAEEDLEAWLDDMIA